MKVKGFRSVEIWDASGTEAWDDSSSDFHRTEGPPSAITLLIVIAAFGVLVAAAILAAAPILATARESAVESCLARRAGRYGCRGFAS
jgi:hypothetical protein